MFGGAVARAFGSCAEEFAFDSDGDLADDSQNRGMAEVKAFDPKALMKAGLNRALETQQPIAVANIARLRRVHPEKSPGELVSYMNKWYIGSVSATGAGAGAAAVVPNGFVQVPAAVADLLAYLEASVLYTLSVAEIHRLNLEDVERRRLLVTAVLIGNSASTRVLEKVIGRTAPYWGRKIVEAIPMAAIRQANRLLGPRFITKWGVKTGVLVLGKQVPLMIGAVIGGGGNGLFGWFVVKSARKILGPLPASWDDISGEEEEELLPAVISDDGSKAAGSRNDQTRQGEVDDA